MLSCWTHCLPYALVKEIRSHGGGFYDLVKEGSPVRPLYCVGFNAAKPTDPAFKTLVYRYIHTYICIYICEYVDTFCVFCYF